MSDLERFMCKVQKEDNGCWIWTAATLRNGYGCFRWNRRVEYAHRVAYEMFVGPIPEGLDIDHLCRNRACVNPAHLEPVTRSENLKRGMTGKTKFNAHLIRKIRDLYESGAHNQYELARMFGTCQGYISNIIRRRIWDHV
jgi:hypothetical protein